MYGFWKCQVDTPFGKEEYLISITPDGGTVHHHTGNIEMDIYSYQEDEFFFQKSLSFPINCMLVIRGFFSQDTIRGIIKVDNLLELTFEGKNDSISV